MVEQVVTLLEMVSAIGLVILLIALAALALLTSVSSVGAVLEHGGDRLVLLARYIERGTSAVAGWVRGSANMLDLLAAALTGQSPAHYVERRRQRADGSRQTGLSASAEQTDRSSARHNDNEPLAPAPTPAAPARTAQDTAQHASDAARTAPDAARSMQRNAPQSARTMRSDAAQHALADVQVARILRHYRTAEALVEALLLAGWGVGQIRATVRIDNNRVSEIAAKYRREEAQHELDGGD
jgi:hypothetical protein